MRLLGCRHGFHMDCVDVWLQDNGTCPKCKRDAGVMQAERASGAEAGLPDPMTFGPTVEVVYQPPATPRAAPSVISDGASGAWRDGVGPTRPARVPWCSM